MRADEKLYTTFNKSVAGDIPMSDVGPYHVFEFHHSCAFYSTDLSRLYLSCGVAINADML